MKNSLRFILFGFIFLLTTATNLSSMNCCSRLGVSHECIEELYADYYDFDEYNIDMVYLAKLNGEKKHFLNSRKAYKGLLLQAFGQIITNQEIRIVLKSINNIITVSALESKFVLEPKQKPEPLATLAALVAVCNHTLAEVPEKYRTPLVQQGLIDVTGHVVSLRVEEIVKAAVTITPAIHKNGKPTIKMHTEDQLFEYFGQKGLLVKHETFFQATGMIIDEKDKVLVSTKK